MLNGGSLLSVLKDAAPHDLCPMPTFSANSGSTLNNLKKKKKVRVVDGCRASLTVMHDLNSHPVKDPPKVFLTLQPLSFPEVFSVVVA